MNDIRRMLVMTLGALAVLPLAGPPPALAQPSAAAVAKRPESRGRVVGAACEYADGYVADYSKLQARAQMALRTEGNPQRPVNVLAYADATTRPPLGTHELPPGRAYCLRSNDFPDGYLTMNCKVSTECPGGAVCQGGLCRAECRDDSDCNAPAVCTRLAVGTERRYCRCDGCVSNLPRESVLPDVIRGPEVKVKEKGKAQPATTARGSKAAGAGSATGPSGGAK
jgi:hypothetical protein